MGGFGLSVRPPTAAWRIVVDGGWLEMECFTLEEEEEEDGGRTKSRG